MFDTIFKTMGEIGGYSSMMKGNLQPSEWPSYRKNIWTRGEVPGWDPRITAADTWMSQGSRAGTGWHDQAGRWWHPLCPSWWGSPAVLSPSSCSWALPVRLCTQGAVRTVILRLWSIIDSRKECPGQLNREEGKQLSPLAEGRGVERCRIHHRDVSSLGKKSPSCYNSIRHIPSKGLQFTRPEARRSMEPWTCLNSASLTLPQCGDLVAYVL